MVAKELYTVYILNDYGGMPPKGLVLKGKTESMVNRWYQENGDRRLWGDVKEALLGRLLENEDCVNHTKMLMMLTEEKSFDGITAAQLARLLYQG